MGSEETRNNSGSVGGKEEGFGGDIDLEGIENSLKNNFGKSELLKEVRTAKLVTKLQNLIISLTKNLLTENEKSILELKRKLLEKDKEVDEMR